MNKKMRKKNYIIVAYMVSKFVSIKKFYLKVIVNVI